MIKIAVLVSGGGTNLQALIDAQRADKIISGEIAAVISSKLGVHALERAEKAGIRTYVMRRADFASDEAYGEALDKHLRRLGIGLIVLAGFMTVLPAAFCRRYENKIINVHPSLIPAFCGEGYYGIRVHKEALAKGVKVTGATVHFVSEVVDGGAIIAQKAVHVREGDTPETLQKRVMRQAEHVLLPEAVSAFCQGHLTVQDDVVHIYNKEKDSQMKILNLAEELQSNAYPGRGIVLGTSECGKYAVSAYFIMGRSENSRNRIFAQTSDGIRTQAFDPSKMVDPSLIIYHPVRFYEGKLIVTNGDQTDTIWEGLKAEKSPEQSLRTREFEPDMPNYTPRISGVVNADGSYQLSILKSFEGNPACCKRFFFEYDTPMAGLGHFIHTYKQDGDPLPSFEGEPKTVAVTGSLREFAEQIWESLNEENKVSLFVRFTELATGQTDTVIYNKNI